MKVGLYDDPGLPRARRRGRAIRSGRSGWTPCGAGSGDAGLEDAARAARPRATRRATSCSASTPPPTWRAVAATRGRTVRFDPDTQAGPRSYAAALQAAGAVADAVDRVLDGAWTARSASCARPAITPRRTAPWASASSTTSPWPRPTPWRAASTRVLVVDFDVHHGNGTQHMF